MQLKFSSRNDQILLFLKKKKKILNVLKSKIFFFIHCFSPRYKDCIVCIVGLWELVDLFNSSINITFNIVINVNIRSSFSLLSYSCK